MARELVHNIRTTPEIEFMKGVFQLSTWKVPYLSVIMTLEDAANNLNLATDLPGSETISWKIDELFQRDIDWTRVENEIVPYLLHSDNPQFFNSLTIALLPYFEEELQTNFNATVEWEAPVLANSKRFDSISGIGPISIGYWNTDQQTGVLAWNTDQLYGVAIDGQHRLAAIKEYCERSGHRQSLQTTCVPVTLLVFHEALDFVAPVATSNIELMRKLFIDLNKHANKVSRAREILLDDRDPHSVCVRALVSNELSGDLMELESATPSMPLSLVDWHTEQAKFDTGPFLTTVLGLDTMVVRILRSKPIKDFTDYRALKTQIEGINRSLDLSLDAASKRIGQLSGDDLTPFAYTPNELETIAEAFATAWTPTLCNLLTKFQPYKDFINLRQSISSLSLDFQHWYELHNKKLSDRRGRNRSSRDHDHLLNRLKHRSHNPLELVQLTDILEKLEEHKKGNLAFNVIFQRAYIEAFLEYNKIGSEEIDALLGYGEDELDDVDFENYDFDSYDELSQPVIKVKMDSEDEVMANLSQRNLERSNEFIYALNALYRNWPDFSDVDCTFEVEEEGQTREIKLWLGTLRKPDSGIDFTQGAATRAKDLLFLIGALYIYDDQTDPEPGSDFDRFWSRCQDRNAPSLCKRAKRAIDRLSADKPGSAATRILLARYGQFDQQRAQDEIYVRVRKIWYELGL